MCHGCHLLCQCSLRDVDTTIQHWQRQWHTERDGQRFSLQVLNAHENTIAIHPEANEPEDQTDQHRLDGRLIQLDQLILPFVNEHQAIIRFAPLEFQLEHLITKMCFQWMPLMENELIPIAECFIGLILG